MIDISDLIKLDNQVKELKTRYFNELEKNPKYSLEIDPENKYNFPEDQKKFLKYYVEYKSLPVAAEFAEIDMNMARSYYLSYNSQQEIRRINLAQYQRQFATRLISLEEIGGYLTALLIDEVPTGDRLKPTDKLKVTQMLIDLNKMIIDSFQNPSTIMAKDIDIEIKNLSISTLEQLIKTNEKMKDKNNIIYDIDADESLSIEEKAYLSTLSTKELLNLIETRGE